MGWRRQKSIGNLLLLGLLSALGACKSRKPLATPELPQTVAQPTEPLRMGAERFEAYADLIANRKVGVVANAGSRVGTVHLLDALLERGIQVEKVFAPEHGFRGKAAAGEEIQDGKDRKTDLPVVSLYGQNKKPTPAQLEGIEVMLFDLQDVGTRFYTYVSTLSYVLEACAQQGIAVVVLDRPNPNGDYVDGPVLKPGFESFVGLHPVPVVHGLTLGEYAHMARGEGWIAGAEQLNLTVVRCTGWTHSTPFVPLVPPSPNLPNWEAIRLYPSLCFFEGTDVSIGRGTDWPFQVVGAPWMESQGFDFKPKKRAEAPKPSHEDELCHGADLRAFAQAYMSVHRGLYWYWLVDAYRQAPDKSAFFNAYFDTLAGTDELRLALIAGADADDLSRRWKPELDRFKQKRKAYLLYSD